MNIPLIFSLIVFSSATAIKGEFKPSENYLRGMFRYLAKEQCSSCKEKLASCKEYRNQLSLCESLNVPVYEKSYNTGVADCERSIPLESPLVCSYDSLRSSYEMEGLTVPENFLNDFIDSLSENV